METESVFRPLPPQWRFMQSKARVRGYGGAMGGGKSRTLCELALDLMLDYPGIEGVVCRQSHVSIVDSTRKTFVEQVLPQELVARKVESGGFDFIEIKNGSVVHFIGLDDPGKQFSREIAFALFDEAHQIREQAVVLVNTRLRQRCRDCIKAHLKTCTHYPHVLALAFNPENPGHWLYSWMIQGATPTKYGYVKEKLFAKDAVASIGDCEFIFSSARDNPYLPAGYVDQNLGGMSERDRERYLEGRWLYTSGQQFFDSDALADYLERTRAPKWAAESAGDITGRGLDRIRLQPVKEGRAAPWWVWKGPVRETRDEAFHPIPAHRYVVSADVSSGTSNDYSALQVIDITTFEQVAEFQGLLDMDKLAVEAFRAAVVYNGAVIVPEVTGGWGAAVVQALKKMLHAYQGGSNPSLYTRRIVDRLGQFWTDKLGWDTTSHSRAQMLTTLERVLREGELGLYSARCHTELVTFVWPEKKDQTGPYAGIPQAQPGTNDDLVIALAIAVHLAATTPRQLIAPVERRHVPAHAATGY